MLGTSHSHILLIAKIPAAAEAAGGFCACFPDRQV